MLGYPPPPNLKKIIFRPLFRTIFKKKTERRTIICESETQHALCFASTEKEDLTIALFIGELASDITYLDTHFFILRECPK
jgi:hypothetical protein